MSNVVEQFIEKLSASLAGETFVRLVCSGPIQPGSPEKRLFRQIDLRGVPHLSVTHRHATRDETSNLTIPDGIRFIREQLSIYKNALLGTTTRDWQLQVSNTGEPRLVGHKPTECTIPSREHDRSSDSLLDASAQDWLRELGVTDANGRTLVSMADKHRQIKRYIEILSHLLTECNCRSKKNQPAEPEFVLADMGCGKGYLTFAAWHLFSRTWKTPGRIIGIETRPDLVATTNRVAKKVGADGLEFIAGSIESAQLPRIDALIALHACNTATDDAIRRGIDQQAKLIVVAPCCHQEIRPQFAKPEPFDAVLKHGIMEERMAEWLTDGLRALYLEWAGYRTKVFEFISSEHTPKNLMIAAIKERPPFVDETAKIRIEELKRLFGVKRHALDSLLEPTHSSLAKVDSKSSIDPAPKPNACTGI